MPHNEMNRLFGAWRAHITASTFSFYQQVAADRCRHGLNVRSQQRLVKNGANKKVLLGYNFKPKFVQPRGKVWLRVAELSGL